MKYLIVVFSVALFFGCKRYDPTPADQLVGTYSITHYILGKDTLISPILGNISSLPNPFIIVEKVSDQVIDVKYISDESNRFNGGLVFTLSLVLDNDKQILINTNNTIDIYSGYSRSDTLYLDYFSWDPVEDNTYRVVTIAKKRSSL